MNITHIEWYEVRLPLVTPFETSYGRLMDKAFDLIVLEDELGHKGMGELVTLEQPDYIGETLATSRVIAKRWLLPLLKGQDIDHPREVSELFMGVKGNEMAKSALETAVWDLFANREGKPLTAYFNETRTTIPVGVSVGIEENLDQLAKSVSDYVTQGYQRVKLKIKPGYDLNPVKRIRESFPDLSLMVDANSAYTLADAAHLQALDGFGLEMIEQPFAENDYLDHQVLQRMLSTRVCLDENITSLKDCQLAVTLGSCRSINLKIPRVGGITEALKIVSFCEEHDIMVWMGGMFESGVGRALNTQFASQSYLSFPGDISASSRYFHEDIITQPFELEQGYLTVPTGIGIGITLNLTVLQRYGKKVMSQPL